MRGDRFHTGHVGWDALGNGGPAGSGGGAVIQRSRVQFQKPSVLQGAEMSPLSHPIIFLQPSRLHQPGSCPPLSQSSEEEGPTPSEPVRRRGERARLHLLTRRNVIAGWTNHGQLPVKAVRATNERGRCERTVFLLEPIAPLVPSISHPNS